MVTGASTADVAVILIDARKGVLTQTRRHSYLVSADRHPQGRAGDQQDGPGGLLGGHVSTASTTSTAPSPQKIGLTDITSIPLSALKGDNMTERQRSACPGTTARR
jgi:bifunctional enzyme CysN/CysC